MSEESGGNANLRETKPRLEELIRRLTQRGGLTPERATQYAAGFGVTNGQELYDLLHGVLGALEQDEHTEALRNAFGDAEHAWLDSVPHRRAYLARKLGVRSEEIQRRERVAISRMADELMGLTSVRDFLEAQSPKTHDAVVTMLVKLEQAVTKQTAVLCEIRDRLKRLDV
ncbi:hypothetical protein [Amycolatopsis alkalitolerans]|uniref:Uncharacterized protein n=1 Tax=Amycolatopsis alkalitolerans TaxID=2547244 RepID=A0A5C4LYD9_9PSEU|nr:hypothetical protein [Amycolatopsis alkalitolerans]TNC23713.1 hypothetical protein FG385_20325 [Amycolatopsis alkalitolerans]